MSQQLVCAFCLIQRLETPKGWDRVGTVLGQCSDRVGIVLGQGWDSDQLGKGSGHCWDRVGTGSGQCWGRVIVGTWIGHGWDMVGTWFGHGWDMIGTCLGRMRSLHSHQIRYFPLGLCAPQPPGVRNVLNCSVCVVQMGSVL